MAYLSEAIFTTGPTGFEQHGTATSFEEAKAEVEATWSRWLDAAGPRH